MAKATKNEETQTDMVVVTKPTTFKVTIKGTGGILFNKMPDLSIAKTEKADQAKETPLDKERRTWREKLYVDENGNVCIPGENIHECLFDGAKYWGAKIPGERGKTYTDVVKKGLIVDTMSFGIPPDSELIVPFGKAVNGNPSKGKKSGAKVYKIRPLMMPWGGSFNIFVFDPRITISVLRTILSHCGTFVGMCDWRPVYGRFETVSIEEV